VLAGLELSRGSSLGARREHLPGGPPAFVGGDWRAADAPWELERIINEIRPRPTTIADRAVKDIRRDRRLR